MHGVYKMSDILNLDELAREARQLKLGGEFYPMKGVTVEDFINIQKESEKIEESGDEVDEVIMSEMIENMVKMVGNSYPTMSKEVLNALNLKQVQAIIEFTVGAESEKIDELSEKKDQIKTKTKAKKATK